MTAAGRIYGRGSRQSHHDVRTVAGRPRLAYRKDYSLRWPEYQRQTVGQMQGGRKRHTLTGYSVRSGVNCGRVRSATAAAAHRGLSHRTAVPDADGRADRADRGARTPPPDRPRRRAGRGRRQGRPVLRGRQRRDPGPAASGATETLIVTHRRRAVLGRRQHDHGPPGAGAGARQRAGRGDRARSRAAARARADRRRVERDPHAGVHPPPRRADRARPRGRRRDRLDALRRHAAGEGVSDPQRPSVRTTSTSIATPTRRSCSIGFM